MRPRRHDHLSPAAFPVRIRLAIPPGGLGQRHSEMTVWLDENCGSDGWALTPGWGCGTHPLLDHPSWEEIASTTRGLLPG